MVIGADMEFEKFFNAVFSVGGWSGGRIGTIKVKKIIYLSIYAMFTERIFTEGFVPTRYLGAE